MYTSKTATKPQKRMKALAQKKLRAVDPALAKFKLACAQLGLLYAKYKAFEEAEKGILCWFGFAKSKEFFGRKDVWSLAETRLIAQVLEAASKAKVQAEAQAEKVNAMHGNVDCKVADGELVVVDRNPGKRSAVKPRVAKPKAVAKRTAKKVAR